MELARQRITTRQQQLENQKDQDAAMIALKAAQREMTRAEAAFSQGALTAGVNKSALAEHLVQPALIFSVTS